MKYLTILFCVLASLQITSCAKQNPFTEPPEQPVIDSIAPASGFVGTQVRLWGSGFSTYSSKNIISINGVRVRVDSPSTSRSVLITIIDSTGTGKVQATVNGKSGEGPIFTFLGGLLAAEAPVITSGKYGWEDGVGYALTMKSLPSTDNGIRLTTAGISISFEATRPGTQHYDYTIPNRLLTRNDSLIEANAIANYAYFQVIYNSLPSNTYAIQIPPRMQKIFSSKGSYTFSAGDTLTVQGNFFGDGITLPSSFSMMHNDVPLAQPRYIKWTNTEIKAIMPAYPELLPDGNVTLTIKVGGSQGLGLVITYMDALATRPGIVTLIAGNASAGFAEGYGAAAQFKSPVGIKLNADGDLFVADALNHRVRKITNITAAGGTVTTFAGSGIDGFKDGSPLTAQFGRPQAIAIDEAGLVYVAEVFNHRIRKIGNGVVETFSGDGSTGVFNAPQGIAMNNHNLAYVSDALNYRIVKIINHNNVTLAGGSQGYAEGNGAAARFNLTYGLVVAQDETLYVTDAQNNAIRKISPQGDVTTFAGGTKGAADGNGKAAQFNYPVAIAQDAGGNLYVAELNNAYIRKISAAGQVVTLHPTSPNGSPFSFINPAGIDVDAKGVLYISDAGSNNIYRMTQ